ncbi:MAG TPA: YraN family protein [Chitinophagales bacterium]|nr:YraN family protein [Chitinophagales bacterium]
MSTSTGAGKELGTAGETLAKKYLEQKGYNVLEINWRHKRWEIDLIAEKNQEIVFVEVKTRTGNFFGEPELAVTKTKQNFLGQAASEYMNQKRLGGDVRFDIISITVKSFGNEILHVEDAFFPRA